MPRSTKTALLMTAVYYIAVGGLIGATAITWQGRLIVIAVYGSGVFLDCVALGRYGEYAESHAGRPPLSRLDYAWRRTMLATLAMTPAALLIGAVVSARNSF